MNVPRDLEAEALEECDREPIHIPGTSQPMGALLAADASDQRILFASENLSTMLDCSVDEALGAGLADVLDQQIRHALANVANLPSIASQRLHLGSMQRNGRTLVCSAHRSADRFVVEFEPRDPGDLVAAEAMGRVQWLVGHVSTLPNLQELLDVAVRQLRAISGYERVKAYTFLPDGAGEVVAESGAGHVESYLGQRFPAYDIPPKARDLYRTTPIRIIGDVQSADVPIRALSADLGDLDLSLAQLRGTAAVHLQYLENMGVRSTMSLPIVCEGRLWGLFAAHSKSPMLPGPVSAMALELAGRLLSMQVEQTLRLRRERQMRASVSVANSLVAVEDREMFANELWPRTRDRLRDMIPCAGIAYFIGDGVDTAGSCPPIESCLAIRDLADASRTDVVATDELVRRLPDRDLGDTGGALVIPIRNEPLITLVYFRDLIDKTIEWAGKPEKEIEVSERGIRLIPRGSFDSYRETVVDQCDSWTAEDLEIANSLRNSLSEAIRSQRDLRRDRLGLVVRELNHRVRNILALIASMVDRPTETSGSVEQFAETLRSRIVSLADAHDMLTSGGFRDVPLRDLVAKELEPFVEESRSNPAVSGPDVEIRADATTILVLVLHELTSNAAKYGALSVPGGEVHVTWRFADEGVELSWRESGGPPVTEPTRRGFGRSIIENAIRYELDGRSELVFAPTGVEADIWLPDGTLNRPVDESPALGTVEIDLAGESAANVERAAERKRALVLEDNFVIAEQTGRLLETMGFAADCYGRIDDAAEALVRADYDVAVLDLDIRGDTSFELAHSLVDRGIPFVFATGYGSDVEMNEEFDDVPVLRKPVFEDDLRQAVDTLPEP